MERADAQNSFNFEKAREMTLDRSALDEIIKTQINPLLRVDGGTVEVVSTDGETRTIALRFGGTYRGSPCRGVVLNHVVIPILNGFFDETIAIEMVD